MLSTERLTAMIANISSYPIFSMELKDIFDILIVASCIYAVLLLLKKTRSLFLLNGIGILTAVYILAQAFNFYLTAQLFNIFFSFFIIIVIIVFQRELRRFFETLSSWRRIGAARKETVPDYVNNQLVQVVTRFAAQKTGALIVIPGVQPLERYFESGTILNGRISVPLLLSIFDPSSPGHDGAAIIEGDRIRAFGVHLPLADNIRATYGLGTRHRAALGLAERTDALIVVVSEERGTISIAHHGEIKAVETTDELRALLHEFLLSQHIDETVLHPWSLVLRNTREKISAIAIAVFLWYTMVVQLGGGVRTIEYAIPIEFRSLPEHYIVEQLIPTEVLVTLTGKNQNFSLLKSEDLAITVDVAATNEGWYKVNISSDHIKNLPSALSVVKLSPRTIQFHIRK